MKNLIAVVIAIAFCSIVNPSLAQITIYHGDHHGGDGKSELHVSTRWRECSFQLNEDLTQTEWNEFAKEAGRVIYFRPMTDAKPLGKRNFEISILQSSSAIDEHKGAWNDTFVHPDSVHWLVGGPRLAIPGFTARMGVTEKLDVAVYITKSPGANYGFAGLQAQYLLTGNENSKFTTAVRGSAVRMYGPEDLNLTVYGADILASREFTVHDKWLRVSPYVVFSTLLTSVHEKSAVVDLADETVAGIQGSVGVLAKVSFARLAVEYNQGNINTISMKLGATF